MIGQSYRQVVTPGPQEAGKWVTVRKGKGQVAETTPVDLPLKNKYSCLSTVVVDSPPGGSSSGRASGAEFGFVAQKGKERRRKAVVIGDSTVRGSDRRLSGGSRETRMVVCLPGAGIRDVSDRIQEILKWEGEEPEVVVHSGTADRGRKGEGVMKSEYRKLGRELRRRNATGVIS